MVDVPVGGGGDGIAGIPTKYVLIGAGVLGVAALLLLQQRGGGGGGDVATGDSVYGSALGPNAALALGGLQTQLMQESGYLQELFTKQSDALGSRIGGLGAQITDLGGVQDLYQWRLQDKLNQIIGLGFNIRDYQDLYHAQQQGGPYSLTLSTGQTVTGGGAAASA